jgi:phosphate transport system protein
MDPRSVAAGETTSHTSREFESELRELRANLLGMAARCERIVGLAMRAFLEASASLTAEVKELDKFIDRDEIETDHLALKILALRQPVAHDLRLITTALKLVTDLERIGDEAVNIAERAEEIEDGFTRAPTPHLEEMADLTLQMLRDALDAFVNAETARAELVRSADDAVDELYGRTLRETTEFIARHPDRALEGVRVIRVAKYLERIADHATNVAEEVIFMVAGQDVRHLTNPPPTGDVLDSSALGTGNEGWRGLGTRHL